jgi:hypothetical protein
MSKVLVEVVVPAADTKFDIYVPLDVRMGEVKSLITGIVSDLTEGKFIGDENSVLCDFETGIIFNINMIVFDLGIKNGSKLMLI